jgi:hypothetical protein
MFSSTLRWFENLKFIFSGATRPIRRGAIFQTARVRKPPFSRHVRKVVISVALHQFQVNKLYYITPEVLYTYIKLYA